MLEYFNDEKTNTNEVTILWHKKHFRMNTKLKSKAGLTAFGGLPTYLDLASATGLLKAIDRYLRVRDGDQGWADRQMILSLVLLNLVGGSNVEDIEKLEG